MDQLNQFQWMDTQSEGKHTPLWLGGYGKIRQKIVNLLQYYVLFFGKKIHLQLKTFFTYQKKQLFEFKIFRITLSGREDTLVGGKETDKFSLGFSLSSCENLTRNNFEHLGVFQCSKQYSVNNVCKYAYRA